MAILIRITSANGETHDVKLDAGQSLKVADGDKIELPQVNPDDVTVTVVNGNLEVAVGDQAPITFQGFAAELDAGQHVSMLIGEGNNQAIIDTPDNMQAAQLGNLETAAGGPTNDGTGSDGSVDVNGLDAGDRRCRYRRWSVRRIPASTRSEMARKRSSTKKT